jgi:hypothetical protein
MTALGENPADYRRLMESLENNLAEGLERQLVHGIGRALWQMQRAERMQDGLAVKRVRSGLQKEELLATPHMLYIHDTYERLCALARTMNIPELLPSPEQGEVLLNAFGATPPDDIKELFPLFRDYWKAARQALRPANGSGEIGPTPAAEQEKESARKRLDALLDPLARHYCMTRDLVMEGLDKIRSPENVASLMAPKDENAMHMQRAEDYNLRQLWRLTNILVKVRNGALA